MHTNILKAFLSLLLCTQSLLASTHCVEVMILNASIKAGEATGKGSSFTGRILFNQYLSSPKVQEPSDTRSFSGSEAWFPAGPFFLDGQVLTPEAGSHLLMKDRQAFVFNNRSKAVFRAFSLVPFPSMGEMQSLEGKTLTTRRLITNKFESAGIVYVDQAQTLNDNSEYFLDGAPSTAEEALQAGRSVRVFAPQAFMLSAFSDDALIDGMAEKAKPETKRYHPRGYLEEGSAAFLPTGGEKMADQPLFGKKTTVLVDGQYQFPAIRKQLLAQCDQAILFNISAKKVIGPEFLVVRSKIRGIEDGRVLSVSAEEISLVMEKDGREEKISLAEVDSFFLNGLPVESAEAFKAGMQLSIYQPLPQRVDVLSLPPYPDFSTSKTFGHLEQSVYAVDGTRHILKEGDLPNRVKALQQ